MKSIKSIFFVLFATAVSVCAGPVSVYGALKACVDSEGKGRICGSKGDWDNVPVQVRGVSLGWSNTGWESSAFFNEKTVNAMIDGWKAEIIRAPLGYADHEDPSNKWFKGYKDDPSNWTRVKTAVDAAIDNDVYVIIDFHSHNAEEYTDAAKTFFETTVAEYHSLPNVIFEIYNEPAGNSWNPVKTYAETIIGALRAKDASNLILVGTPDWAAKPNLADGNYLSDDNVGYVFHFYAYSHKASVYSSRLTTVINAGKPMFITEYGTTHYTGGTVDEDGGDFYDTHDPESTDAWFEYMDANKISSCAWNVNDKYEGAAFFGTSKSKKFDQSKTENYTNEEMMTPAGKYIFNKLKYYSAEKSPIAFASAAANKMFAVRNGVNLQVSSAAKVQVFDLKGNTIRIINLGSGSHSIALSELPKSMYIVKVTTSNHSEVFNVPVR